MPLIRNLGSSLLLAFAVCSASAQTIVDLSFYPGVTSVPPGPNGRFSLFNGGCNIIIPGETGNYGFFFGGHVMNRGTGGRIAVIGPNNAFVRYVRQSANFYYAHFPVGLWLKHEKFYANAGFSIDRLLFYQERYNSDVVSRQSPNGTQNTLFGLHFETGLRHELNENLHIKTGVYLSNTFAGATGNPFINFGVTVGLNIRLNSEDDEEEEEELYEY